MTICILKDSPGEDCFEMPAAIWGGDRKACARDAKVIDELAMETLDKKYVYSGDLASRYDLQQGHVTADHTKWVVTSQPNANHGEMIKLGRFAHGMELPWRPHLALYADGVPNRPTGYGVE